MNSRLTVERTALYDQPNDVIWEPYAEALVKKDRMMISREAIDEYVDRLVDHFRPEAVILFGSQATGTADSDSDVDLLVIMDHGNARNLDEEIEIDRTLPRGFPLDILVRKPEELKRRLDAGDMALRLMLQDGETLYERS